MMKASDIMTKDVVTIRGSATVAEAALLMQERGWRALIVDQRDEQDAYGIITETDIVYKVIGFGKDPRSVRVYEVMTKPCIVVNPDLGVEHVARLFADNGLLRAPVIQNKLLGIISVSDILTKSKFIEYPLTSVLEKDLQDAIQNANQICAEAGPGSRECAMAWNTVDALETELAHHRLQKITKTTYEEYCEEFPEAMSPRMFDNLCSG